MQKNNVFSMVWAILLILALLPPVNVAHAMTNWQGDKAALDANQINFAIKMTNGTRWQFMNLKIEGENQRGEYVLWNTPSKNTAMFMEQTTKWWWRSTIILTFDIVGKGTRTCIVDNLKLEGDSTNVIYDPNYSMCSGSSSALTNLQTVKEYQDLRKFVKDSDAYQIVEIAKDSRNPTGCIGKIKEALTIKAGQFNIALCQDVRSQAIEQLAEILMDYGLIIIYGK